jgi:carboxyl-terminal processing protease
VRQIETENKRSRISLSRLIPPLAAGVLIFFAGVGVGQGRIRVGGLSSDSTAQKNLPADLDYSSVEQAYDALKKDFDGNLDATKLLDGIKAGLAKASGDTYTEYMNADEAKQFNDELNGSFSGIGAELSKDDATNSIVVVAPIAGFPAEKAGLKAKDVITEIDGKTAYDITVTDAVNRIRGTKGTKVTLKVMRDGNQELTFEITRDDINIPSVKSETLDGNIGYLQISRFGDDTADLSTKAAQSFKAAGVRGVIVDVRGDPGGLLDAAVKVASLWLPNGKTVLTERRDNVVVQTYAANGNPLLQGIPTTVLIDDGSASASEILAGALKDNNAAKLIGNKSFGKGSVQQLEKLSGGGLLKVTIARWYTPNGRNIDKEGIEPDQKVDRSADDVAANKDPQKDTALQLLRQ